MLIIINFSKIVIAILFIIGYNICIDNKGGDNFERSNG